MASRGNRPLKKNENLVVPDEISCMCCNKSYSSNEFYNSDSDLHKAIGRIPYCRSCLDNFYNDYLKKYEELQYSEPQRKSIERICMILNLYYSDKIFELADRDFKKNDGITTLFALYLKHVKLYQYRNKNYDTTIHERYKDSKDETISMSMYSKKDADVDNDIQEAIDLFGQGFSNEDYMYLIEQYRDWTMRHECKTKAQEEIFKQICFVQLDILKATRSKMDTKDLLATFQKLLDTAKLQPKQNSGDATSDNQTFGTLIDRWENTRPLPEIDEELKDVDKIGLYVDVFFKGHLSKMMGIKNGLSNSYSNFMKKYTVDKPEYADDESSEALFDAIFGDQSFNSSDE